MNVYLDFTFTQKKKETMDNKALRQHQINVDHCGMALRDMAETVLVRSLR